MGFVDFARCHFRSGDDFRPGIDASVRFILKFRFTASLPDYGSVRIGGGDMITINRAGLCFVIIIFLF